MGQVSLLYNMRENPLSIGFGNRPQNWNLLHILVFLCGKSWVSSGSTLTDVKYNSSPVFS